jgi:hypothetical protein
MWQIPLKDDTQFDYLNRSLEIKKWGILPKNKVNNTNEWVT